MPRRSTRPCFAAALALVLLLPGCVALRPAGPRAEAGIAAARETSFRGWRGALRLDNGLVSLAIVPQVGGRTLDYSLDGWNFLFIGRRELGVLPSERATYHQFGGHFAQLHPVARWRSLQSRYPAALFMGAYDAHIAADAGPVAIVEMVGENDLATGTSLDRRIELFAGSTRVRITDTLSNVRLVPQNWGIHSFVQLKGHPTRSGVLREGARATGDLALYVPLNPDSRFPGGVRHLLPDDREAIEAQWDTGRYPGLAVVRYRARLTKALVDPALPWIACVDHARDYVFVQTCRAPQKAVLTAALPVSRYPFVELQSFAPLATLDPGDSATFVQEWYAARCPAPVLDVTDAGVVSSPLTLLRGEGKTWAAGTFGVFHLGAASLVFRRTDGSELARIHCGPVHPHRPFRLNRVIELPRGTAEVALEVRDPAGRPVGHLGTIVLDAAR